MDPITPSSTPSSSNVDSLLNDILGGQPSSAMPSMTPATQPPTPDPTAIPTLSLEPDEDSLSERIARETSNDEAEETSERMHDILEGASTDTTQVDPGMTPIVEESSLESVAAMPTMSLDSVPAPTAMPTIAPFPPAADATTPVVPMAAVSPGTSPYAQTPQPQVAQVPQSGFPKASIAAGLAVLAVVIAGVGAGVALSGQDQDNRNQAYVAPAQRTSVAAVSATSTVAPSVDQSFTSFRQQFPAAKQVALSEQVTGNAYFALNEAIGSWQFFVEIDAPAAEDGSVHFAWVEAGGDTYPLSSFEVGQNGKAYASGLVPMSVQSGKVVISRETPGSDIFGLLPSDKITSVSF